MFRSAGWLIAVGMGPAALIAVSGTINAAYAQEPVRGETVIDRARPELDPLGVRMGGFLFFPQIGVAEEYNDNVFATETGELDDYITVVTPSLQLRSDWNNHSLNLYATGEIARYGDFDTEDYDDYTVGGDVRLDVTRDGALTAAISYSTLHEDRGSPDSANGIEPTEYTVLFPEIAYSQKFGKFALRLAGNLRRYDFDDVLTSVPSTVNNDDRDRDESEASLRLGYDIVPGYQAFVRGTYFNREYDATVDDNGFQRSSTGYEAVVGTAIDFTGVTFGEIFAGYRAQDYDEVTFNELKGGQYGGQLTWNVTGMTTLTGLVERTIEETTLNNSSGYFATHGGLAVDHELLRNLLIGGNVDYTTAKYEQIIRDDNTTEVGIYGKYLLNRHFYVTGTFDFTSLDSSVVNESYDRNVFMLRLETQY